MNLCDKAEPVIEEITIEETPTEVQLSVEPPPLPQLEVAPPTDESSMPAVSGTATTAEEPTAKAEIGTSEGEQRLAVSDSSDKAIKESLRRDDSSLDSRSDDRAKRKDEKPKKQKNGDSAGAPSLFGRRALVVKLERVRLDASCLMPNGRVDLKVLKRLRPDLFVPVVSKVALGDRRQSASSHKKEVKKRERKSSTEKKTAREKKKKPVVLSSGSDSSDSELEAMRARMSKPLLSLSSKAPPPMPSSSSSAVQAKKDSGRKVTVSSSDEEDRKIREKSEKKKRKKTTDAGIGSKAERKSFDRPAPPMKKSSKLMSSDSEKEETKPKKKVSAPVSSSGESDRDEKAKSVRPLPPPPPLPRAAASSSSDDDVVLGGQDVTFDDDSEPESRPEPTGEKKMFANPLFALKQLIEQKEKAGASAEGAETPNVRELLVEKLYSALSSEDRPPDEKRSPEDAAKKQRMVHPAMFTAGSAMRAFRDLLRMELGPALAFLEPKAAPTPLSEFEDIVMKAIDNLDCSSPGKRFLLDAPPDKVNHMVGDDAWFSKYRQLKRCHVVVRDVKKTAGYRSRFARALELHDKDAIARRRRRKERLLNGLKMVKEYSSSNSWQRGKKSDDGYSSKFSKLHRRSIDSDSDSDSEGERRRRRDAKWKKKDYEDPNKVQSGFKYVLNLIIRPCFST